jgi:hypothetical protein
MIIICGKTIAEVERDLEMAKQAIASGMPYGIGGETIEDVEQAMGMLHSAVGGAVAPISNPNYEPPHSCGCSCDYCDCNVCGGCEDEDDPCEDCEGECEGCDNYCEDGLDGLTADDVDNITAELGLPAIWAEMAKQVLGL